MKKNLLLVLAIAAISTTTSAQKSSKKDRLFINVGAGPSYSLFYASGGWVRNFGYPNFDNVTVKRNAWAFSHFAELEWRFRNPRWSLRAGYSMHNFFPEFQGSVASGTNEVYVDTHESDKFTYLQSTVQFALLKGWDRIEIGTGLYYQLNRRQEIEYFGPDALSPGTVVISEYRGEELGLPFNLDYTHFLKSRTGIGCRLNFNYSASVDVAEHVAIQFFVKAGL